MAKFVSKRSEFRLIVRPGDRTVDEARRTILIPGERCEFHNHLFHTTDQSLIDYLKSHPLYNAEFTCAEGETVADKKKAMDFGARSTMSGTFKGTSQRNLNELVEAQQKKDKEKIKADEKIQEDLDVDFAKLKAKLGLESPITKDEITTMIDQKLDDFFWQMKSLIQGQNQVLKSEVPSQPEKPKRVYKCKECGKEFESGFAVSFHKKEAHK